MIGNVFTPEDSWLHEHQEYSAAVERVNRESKSFQELQEATPEDSEAIARQRSRLKAAIESRLEVRLRLTNERSKAVKHEPR